MLNPVVNFVFYVWSFFSLTAWNDAVLNGLHPHIHIQSETLNWTSWVIERGRERDEKNIVSNEFIKIVKSKRINVEQSFSMHNDVEHCAMVGKFKMSSFESHHRIANLTCMKT